VPAPRDVQLDTQGVVSADGTAGARGGGGGAHNTGAETAGAWRAADRGLERHVGASGALGGAAGGLARGRDGAHRAARAGHRARSGDDGGESARGPSKT
jgi:hypothetical protein